MLFLRQACAAIVLVMLTLGMQSAGMTGLIEWAKSHFAKGAQAFGPLSSAVLVVRFTALIICLHILEILLWTAFYRWRCLVQRRTGRLTARSPRQPTMRIRST